MAKKSGPALLAGIVLALSGNAWAADTVAVGLVLRAGGAVVPLVSSYSEVPDGTSLALGPGAQLTLLHYESCKQMTVSGGRVTIRKQAVALTEGARIDKETPNKCPTELRVKPTGVAGGVRMRALDLSQTLPQTLPVLPECLLVGAQADRFIGASISASIADGPGAPVVMTISGRRLVWPKGQPPLQKGHSYKIHLQPLPGGKPYTAPFDAGSGKDDVCLLRVD